jgi:uncharacterized protein YacL
MLLNVLRIVFVILVATVAMRVAEYCWWVMPAPAILAFALGLASLLVALDVFIPQKSLLAISGVFFGLIVGMVVAYGFGLILDAVVMPWRHELTRMLEADTVGGYRVRAVVSPSDGPTTTPATEDGELVRDVEAMGTTRLAEMMTSFKVLIGVVCCYMSISFILQTKDDIRFVIPYVEFVKQRKGEHPLVLDTSVIIDGRIIDILEAWHVDAPVIVPRFVLQELHAIADSSDKLKRNRGRRGLDVVNKLQGLDSIDLQFQEARATREEEHEDVDQRLVSLSRRIEGRLVTNDYNLNKMAQIRGVDVINLNDLANALKPVFLPGESMQVKIIKPGEEPGQGVGYLEDGTMIVVESAREKIGQMVTINVTSVLQTSAGRMVFGRAGDAPPPDQPRRGPRRQA